MGKPLSLWQNIGDYLGTLGKGGFVHSIGVALDPDRWLPGGKDAAFTLALVALLAKMAAADGIVTNSEIIAFKSIVEIPKDSQKQIDRIFELAQQDVAGYRSYAKKIARLFSDNPETLEHVLESLFYIASADGMIHEDEYIFLKNISEIFGFSEVKFKQIAAAFMLEDTDENDPYLVLGLEPDATIEQIKDAYHALVLEYHPDRLISKGLPKEMLALSNGRMATINSAYNSLLKATKTKK